MVVATAGGNGAQEFYSEKIRAKSIMTSLLLSLKSDNLKNI